MNSLHKHLIATAIAVALVVVGLVMDSRQVLAQSSQLEPAVAGSTPLRSTVHVLFGFDTTESGIFPSDVFTVPDGEQKTGLQVNLPLPDCSVRVSDCMDLTHINRLDGFNLQPRVTIPFDGDIDPTTVNSSNTFFVELGEADVEAIPPGNEDRGPRVIGVNQLVWDPATHVLAAESDEQLRQHTRYAFVVTGSVLDTSGTPVGAAEELERFRHDLNFGQTHDPVLDSYRKNMLDALAALRKVGISEEQVAGLSVFTTQSATAILEHIRDSIKASTPAPPNFHLGPGGAYSVYPRSAIASELFNTQIKINPPTFAYSTILDSTGQTPPDGIVNGVVPLHALDDWNGPWQGRIAYGSFQSPRYIDVPSTIPNAGPEPIMDLVGTRSGLPSIRRMDTIDFNLYLPPGPQPANGWPVLIWGLGGNDMKDGEPNNYVAAVAELGIALITFNVVGQSFGPLSTLQITMTDGSKVEIPAAGRAVDTNGDNSVGSAEGVVTVTPQNKIIGMRDSQRQMIADLMQLVRVIENGVDVEGDGIIDLDATKISYGAVSFGAEYGLMFVAVEPNVHAGMFASIAGGNSRWDILRLRPAGRGTVGSDLASRTPSLLNSNGLTTWFGLPCTTPYFNENIPMRNLPIVVNDVVGAMDIQKYIDTVLWTQGAGHGDFYARNLRTEPLPGLQPKNVFIQVQQGDTNAVVPRTMMVIRAGDLLDRTSFTLWPAVYATNNTIPKNPHGFMQWFMHTDITGPVGRGGLNQLAAFFASGGTTIITPTGPSPAGDISQFFQVPIAAYTEEFFFIP